MTIAQAGTSGSSPLARGARPHQKPHSTRPRFIPARAGSTSSPQPWRWPAPVHPRSRGEHADTVELTEREAGSSPLARGARDARHVHPPWRRFIPARAGSTAVRALLERSNAGSSPLARGARVLGADAVAPERFIPARAGSTQDQNTTAHRDTVHLRSRGEHLSSGDTSICMVGSSPLARGAPRQTNLPPVQRRFIPARAGSTRSTCAIPSATSVHPRSRGEHTSIRPPLMSRPGSSPLARGARGQAGPHPEVSRFIPARAGSTSSGALAGVVMMVHPRSRGEHKHCRVLADWELRFIPARAGSTCSGMTHRERQSVHPRSRGEHGVLFVGLAVDRGSSPLAREARFGGFDGAGEHRFIPARAGSTMSGKIALLTPSVHPRSRGEHSFVAWAFVAAAGSSPLARGALRLWGLKHADRRFIPARAGSTRSARDDPSPDPVHPRSRGEHADVGAQHHEFVGSSPLARGALFACGRMGEKSRFIPARAGSTHGAVCLFNASAVHPRSRGEHCPTNGTPANANGSSPLARGAHPDREDAQADPRFIPARAGSTPRPPIRSGASSVHPRSRGEHQSGMKLHVRSSGSSPLARGARGRPAGWPGSGRFIPARAGSTNASPTTAPSAAVHPRSRGEHKGRLSAEPYRVRFIPARAGSTPRKSAFRVLSAVHPRSRGEHPSCDQTTPSSPGSSPLARGAHGRRDLACHIRRFIPARAGSTPWARVRTVSTAVHPRSRGEHSFRNGATSLSAGSSPLARGALSRRFATS